MAKLSITLEKSLNSGLRSAKVLYTEIIVFGDWVFCTLVEALSDYNDPD
jgi:hypothetical protein